MAMNAPLFDINIEEFTAEVNSYQPGTGFLWPTLFPLRYTRRFDIHGLEGDDGIPVAADRVAFNTKAPKKSRRTIGSWSGKLSKISVSRDKDEVDINNYNDDKAIADSSTTNKQEKEQLVALVYDDVSFCNSAMDARVELDALRIACSGLHTYKQSIDGDMATEDIINFNIPEENFVGVSVGDKKDSKGKVLTKSVVWTDYDKADGIADIIQAQELVASKGLPKPRFAFMEKAKFQDLCAQKAVARRLFPQVNDLSVISAEMVNLASINAYMQRAEHNYPTIIVIDSYVTIQHKDGTEETVKPWNVNVVTLAPSTQLGWTWYKPVPMVENTDALQTYASYYKVTRYSDVNPMLETTMAEAYVQPALIHRKSTVLLNTAATSWNDGDAASE
jgi:hypothetical protein